MSPAGDLDSFRLYRGSSADFIPDPSHFVAATADSGYVDAGHHAADLAEDRRLAPRLCFVRPTRGADRLVTRTAVAD